VDREHPLSSSTVDALTERIAGRLRDVMVEVDPAADVALVRRVERLYARARQLPDEPGPRLSREQAIARGLDVLRRRDPVRLAGIAEALGRYERRLARFGLPGGLPGRQARAAEAASFVAREFPLAVLLVPVCVLAVLAFAVPYRIVDMIATRRSIEHEIQATVKVMGGAVLHVLWILLLAFVAWRAWGSAAGFGAALGLPTLALAGVFALERETAAWRAVRIWWALQRVSPATARRVARLETELAALLDDAQAWVASADHAEPATTSESGRLP
jgi:hypothetical protein